VYLPVPIGEFTCTNREVGISFGKLLVSTAGFSESRKKAVHDAEFPAALELAYRVEAGR
jgi:hypothetical protein